MSADQKVGYWNDRIGVYLEEHPELTAAQQRAIAEARVFLKAELFEETANPGMPASAVREQEFAQFEVRMIAGLGEKVTRELFYGFGPSPTEQRTERAVCECRYVSDCHALGLPGTFCNLQEECIPITGCGIMGSVTCIGLCWIL